MKLLLYRGESFDPNFYYHTGLDIDHAFYLKSAREYLFVPKLNEAYAKKHFRGSVITYSDPFQEISKHTKPRRSLLHCDFVSLSAAMAERLSKISRIKSCSKQLALMRVRKKPEEVSAIRSAARLTREIFASLDFEKARTELDLEKQILVMTAQMGLEPAFAPIVATDSSTGFPHYYAGKKKLGSLVMIDYGVRYKHYCSDLTRCFILDGDRKKKQEYERLRDVFHSIIDKIPEQETGAQLAKMSASLMEKAGFPQMIHSIGHGVGLEVHELPRLSPKSRESISGSVLAIEPAFYKSYGMRFEETIHFDGKKVRIL
jgi:Xaa-Pro aminopeptidase